MHPSFFQGEKKTRCEGGNGVMPSGCARLPSCRGRKGDSAVKTNSGKPPALKTQTATKTPVPAIKDAAPAAINAPKKGKKKGGGPPPAAAAFLAAKKKAEEEATAAAAAAEEGGDAKQESDGGSDDDSTDIDDDNALALDTFDPSQDDFEGMQSFVCNMLDGQDFDSEGLVNLMIEQAGEVGMVMKIVDEEDVYGVLSVTNLNQASSRPCLKQISDFILAKCPASLKDTFANALSGSTGFIISERCENTPQELAVPLICRCGNILYLIYNMICDT
jgi:hypothetical protein